MAAPTDVNNDNNSEILNTSSQPNASITRSSNKRLNPDSPDTLPATQKQNLRQIRRRNSVGDLRDLDTIKKTPVSRKNITDKVLEALTSPDVLNRIIPVLSEKIGETISTLIESEIQACVSTHINPLKEIVHKQEKTIENHEQKICKQFIQINTLERTIKDQSLAIGEHEAELQFLHKKMSELEIRLESQEQYSRRTSLRFHNIKVPVNERGRIIHPVNTDDLILDICNTLPGVNLTINDIGRSHVIGRAKSGKCQVIVRFLSYRTRNLVYTNKKSLRANPDGIFITENLTPYRTTLTKRLAQLKFDKQIQAYWTSDGRIFVKRTETSRKEIITNFDDIASLECRFQRQSRQNNLDCPSVFDRGPEHSRPETQTDIEDSEPIDSNRD